MNIPHCSVLLDPICAAVKDQSLRHIIDCTTGAGGHALALLSQHPEIERFTAIDQDPIAFAIAKERLKKFDSKITWIADNFSHMDQYELPPADMILMDLGVSSMQLDEKERGMSFSKEGPLDMRMNPNQELDAATIINTWPQKKIEEILWNYGEEPRSRKAAAVIVANRPFSSTLQFSKVLSAHLPPLKGKKINPMTLIFQALRIAVNDELASLEAGLKKAFDILAPGGFLQVIAFHSLEDRIVKQFFHKMSGSKGGKEPGVFENPPIRATVVTKKPITATLEELQNNSRSRSAKLRILQKLNETVN